MNDTLEWNEMDTAQTEPTIIRVTSDSTNMWESSDRTPDEDEAAFYTGRYENKLLSMLRAWFPKAEIEFAWTLDGTLRISTDGDPERAEQLVHAASEQAFEYALAEEWTEGN